MDNPRPDDLAGRVEGVIWAAWVYLLVLLVVWQLLFSDDEGVGEWL